jgi:uroporphyrinogen-III synthase
MGAAIVVTRPAPECERWVARLQAAGRPALALPLIELRALAPPWPTLGSANALEVPAALMFVSAAAVRYFFSSDAQGLAVAARLRSGQARAWVTGPGSARALLDAGIERRLIDLPALDAQELDSESLWAVVSPQAGPGFAVLIVRGRDAHSGVLGRSWLADRLVGAGAELAQCVVYERTRPAWGAPQRDLARRAAADGSQWLLSSSQALAHLQALMPGQDWRAAQALVTHRRIAQAALETGFGSVAKLDPGLRKLLASIESSDESGEFTANRFDSG